jgi:hypothetical protein
MIVVAITMHSGEIVLLERESWAGCASEHSTH